MKPLTVFIHVPKVGGRSFLSFLKNNHKKVINYPYHLPLDWSQVDCIHGHTRFTQIDNEPEFKNRDKQYYTMLRNPIERTISYYYHCNCTEILTGKKVSIEEYILNTEASDFKTRRTNAMTWYLGDGDINTAKKNLLKCQWGFTEEFNNFIRRLSFPNKDYVYTGKSTKRKQVDEYPDSVIKSIIDANNLDWELWSYAKKEALK